MSYLLTEIAMEMLGYRFYDINGIEQPISLDRARTEPIENTKTLEETLGVRWDSDHEEFVDIENDLTKDDTEDEIVDEETPQLTKAGNEEISLDAEKNVLRNQILAKYCDNLQDPEITDSEKFAVCLALEKDNIKSEIERLTAFHEYVERKLHKIFTKRQKILS